MKKITLKIYLLIAFSFVMSSSVLAGSYSVQPYFNFNYRDAYYYLYTGYTIDFAIYNTNGPQTGPLGIGNSGTFPPNPQFPYPFTYGNYVTIYDPTPPSLNCFRIRVRVVRSDNTTRFGWSDWTDADGLTNGSLTINVDVF